MNGRLSVGIGASNGRHIVDWIEDGKVNTEEIYRFANGTDTKGGRLIWNTERLFSEIKNGLKQAKEIGKNSSYIGIDTWAVDYAIMYKEDKLIDEVYAYCDRYSHI